MVRGQVLRGFDREMAGKIADHMAMTGTRFIRDAAPVRLEEVAPATPEGRRRVRVVWRETGGGGAGKEASEEFDTVVFATGRGPVTAGLGLEKAGVLMDSGGKVLGGGPKGAAAAAAAAAAGSGTTTGGALQQAAAAAATGDAAWAETSSVPSIHAVGDVLSGKPELTPVAIRAGKLLAQRIVAGVLPTDEAKARGAAAAAAAATSPKRLSMDYASVATTIFTPIEYGCVGLSEEEALAHFGGKDGEGVEVYHAAYDTLELSAAHRPNKDGVTLPPQCFTKVVTLRGDGDPERQRVLGIHVLGPSAGEVIQGFAAALRLGLTKADLDATVGIHPTHAEEVVGLDTTKRSGVSALKTSC
jgi:pyruvate/2-oxoglutarate dehydrogenase complex dihydrolipoamide dehydrogenase (E3) component